MVTKEEKSKTKLELKQRKEALQAEIGRRKLLQQITEKKRSVSVLRKVEDKIPSIFLNGERREEEPRKQLSFLGKGGLL